MGLLRNLAAVAAVVALLNVVVQDKFYLQILILTLLWAAAGMAWNLTAKAGQISLGHSAFTGIGALTFVLLLRDHGLSPWLGMLAGMAIATVTAILIGIPTLRLRGFYFTLATMAYPLILMLVAIHKGWVELTVPFHPEAPLAYLQFRDPHDFVWVGLGLLLVTLAVTELIDRSRLGQALRAIRDNEVLAQAVGVPTATTKIAAFAISAALTAAMGVIWVSAVLLVVSVEEVFSLGVVILMLSVTFVGGVARTWGPIVGAVLLIPLAQLLTSEVGDRVPGAETLVYGAALVLVALLAPDGLLPRAEALVRRRRREPAKPEPDPEAGARLRARRQLDGGPLLSVRDVSKRFGGAQVLRGVDLEVAAGGRSGLIGPNGAGKTTLFNIVCGQVRPDAGEIRFAGRDIARLGPAARYRLGMSRTFQVPQGFHRMTPLDNVRTAAIGAGLRRAEAAAAAAAALDRVGLGGRAGHELAALSTLEIKLLELARAIVSEPSLLLLDEPLAGLNEEDHRHFFQVLDEVRGPSTGVLVIEHSVRSLVAHVEHLFALDEGTIVASGTPQHVIAEQRVIEAYLGKRFAAASIGTTERESDAFHH
jgi:ABC-type branched-subunit amino acid transport system ATPase component/ABC-type branched-subunit amino acid transport system permease subunit